MAPRVRTFPHTGAGVQGVISMGGGVQGEEGVWTSTTTAAAAAAGMAGALTAAGTGAQGGLTCTGPRGVTGEGLGTRWGPDPRVPSLTMGR